MNPLAPLSSLILAVLLAGVEDPARKIHPSLLDPARAGDREVVAWVFFRDKGDESRAAIHAVELSYNERAIERRRLRRTAPGLFDVRDLPVNGRYVASVSGTGARIRVESRWVNAVSVVASTAELLRIAELPFVRSIEPVRRLMTRPAAGTPPDDSSNGTFYGVAEEQLAQINLIALHNAGYSGEGVIIGVLDGGFRRTHDAFTHPDHPLEVVAEYDFVNDDPNTAPEPGDHPEQHRHGTLILGTLAAYDPGSIVGGAYDASYILAKVEDLTVEEAHEEDFFAAGLEFIEANGGDVATSSVVIFDVYSNAQLNGRTSVMARAFNVATQNGVHGFQGAGNSGHDADPTTLHLVTPADAISVNTIGAVDRNGVIAWFSSDGPTADRRVKPEFLARGVDTHTVDPFSDTQTITASGTSLSTPLAACVGACLTQAHPDWTVYRMRGALVNTSDYFVANGTFDPVYVHGFGILNAHAANEWSPSMVTGIDPGGALLLAAALALSGILLITLRAQARGARS